MANIKRVNLLYSNPNQMKKLSWLLACFFTLTLSAQEKFVVMGKSPDLYVVHTADGKENLQAISILFGQSVAKLSAYNNITAATPLTKGTAVKIPISKDNIIQQKTESGAPVYHLIGKGDNLYRLSQIYNKVPISSIKEWNSMKNDVVKDGQLLIVGYMVNAPTIAAVKTPEIKPEPKREIPAVNNPPVQNIVPDKKNTDKTAPATKPTVIAAPVIIPDPVKTKSEDKPVINETKPVAKTAAPVNKPAEKTDYTPVEGDEGYFASAYAQHPKESTQQFHSGDAAVFKTISGWTDRKYYVLMNDVEPRTIVRITGPGNKNICAMVLGPLQETKGASGLLLRISNSAASALGITDAKFTLTVTYFE